MYPFSVVVLDNEENIIAAVGLYTFVVGDVGVGVSPVPRVLSVKDGFPVDCGLVRWNVLWVGLFVFFEQVVALIDDEILGEGNEIAGLFSDLVSVFVEGELVLVVGHEDGDPLQDPAVVDLVVIEGNHRLLPRGKILVVESS